MIYFTQNFIDFFKELSSNNNSEWFKINKIRYEKDVKNPFEFFTSSLINEIEPFIPNLKITTKEAIFRINRDIRFSKDKSPYKLHCSAAIAPGGKKDFASPGLYIQISAEDLRIYSGLYELNTAQIEIIRNKILKNINEFLELINNNDFKNSFGEIQGDKYKRVPKGFEGIYKKTDLILNKQFYYFQVFPVEKILESDLIDFIIEKYKPAINLNKFFSDALLK